MRHAFRPRFSRYMADEAGNIALTFGLALLALLMMVGVALDSRRMDVTQNSIQAAVDTAIIAGAREYLIQSANPVAAREAAATTAAVTSYQTNLSNVGTNVSVTTPLVTFPADGEVMVTATETLPLAFGGLFGKPSVNLSVNGTAVAGDSRRVEIVLALDNTTSMFDGSRFNLMRGAAKGFVNTMFDETPAAGLTAISVVPWAAVVNINSEQPGAWDPSTPLATTPPMSGSRTIPNAPFQSRTGYLLNPDTNAPYASSDLTADFAPTTWRGCVRAAPNERNVNAVGVVTNSLTDGVPAGGLRWPAALIKPENQTFSTLPPSPPSPGGGGGGGPSSPPPVVPGPQGAMEAFYQRGADAQVYLADISVPANRVLRCTQDDRQWIFNGTNWQNVEGLRNVYISEDSACSTTNNQPANSIVQACLSDPNEFAWLAGGGNICPWEATILPWNQQRPVSGPNMNCPTAMLGLSSDRGQILEKLNHMYPVPHGTQADIGVMWGLRALSPRSQWVNFFGHTGAQAPMAFNDADVRKVMILLTDGANEAPFHYEGYYGCLEGWRGPNARNCSTASGISSLDRASLDALTRDACEATRLTYGVEVYTIAVNVTDTNAVNLLADCAGDPTRAFNITAAQLDATFDTIAARELRIKE